MKYVLSNWKMYVGPARAERLLNEIQDALHQRFPTGAATSVSIVVCPSFVSLVPLQAIVEPPLVSLGAQNCHWESEGPFTGEVSPVMLRGLVDYVLVGHSERRAAGETDEQIARKVAAVVDAGLTPILFVGEDEPSEAAIERTEERLRRGLERVDPSREEVLVVYEPTWAIGAREAAPPGHVQGVVEQLKSRLAELGAREPRIIYGGTVNPGNVEQFAALEVLDGVGATRAGLDPGGFLHIIDRVAAAGSA
jgi:triosephosphate isomerase (TIM)